MLLCLLHVAAYPPACGRSQPLRMALPGHLRGASSTMKVLPPPRLECRELGLFQKAHEHLQIIVAHLVPTSGLGLF